MPSPAPLPAPATVHWLPNLLIYQANWFICILGGNSWLWAAMLLLGLHLYLTPQFTRDLRLMVILLFTGMILDGGLKYIGFFSFSADHFPIPLWLMVIWLTLATLPNHSLGWLKNRPYWSAVLASLGGPAAYLGGARLGAASLNWDPWFSLVILGLLWGLTWPAVMWLSNRPFSQIPPP